MLRNCGKPKWTGFDEKHKRETPRIMFWGQSRPSSFPFRITEDSWCQSIFLRKRQTIIILRTTTSLRNCFKCFRNRLSWGCSAYALKSNNYLCRASIHSNRRLLRSLNFRNSLSFQPPSVILMHVVIAYYRCHCLLPLSLPVTVVNSCYRCLSL